MSRVGVGRDVMTFWIRGGVLQPMPGPVGPGKHLRFEWYEANIAAIMNQLRILGVKIEGMLSIGRVYREAIAYFADLELNRDEVQALQHLMILEGHFIATRVKVAEARHRMGEPGFDPKKHPRIVELAGYTDEEQEQEFERSLLAAGGEVHGAQRVTQKTVAVREKVDRAEFYRQLDPYLTVTEQPKPGQPGLHNAHPDEMTYFWRAGEGDDYRFAWGEGAGPLASKDGAISMIAVDVTAALYPVWNQPEAGADPEAEQE